MNRVEVNTMRATADHHNGSAGPIAHGLTVAPRGISVGSVGHTPTSHLSALPLRSPVPAGAGDSHAPLPIWLAVLMATHCQARSNGERRDIRWNCVAGRAVYTNFGGGAEKIEPLGVSLSVGESLAVYWTPGETAYTMDVYSQAERYA